MTPEVIQIQDSRILKEEQNVIAVGFEPTPPERLEPKSSALDHSATLPMPQFSDIIHQIQNLNGLNVRSYEIVHLLK